MKNTPDVVNASVKPPEVVQERPVETTQLAEARPDIVPEVNRTPSRPRRCPKSSPRSRSSRRGRSSRPSWSRRRRSRVPCGRSLHQRLHRWRPLTSSPRRRRRPCPCRPARRRSTTTSPRRRWVPPPGRRPTTWPRFARGSRSTSSIRSRPSGAASREPRCCASPCRATGACLVHSIERSSGFESLDIAVGEMIERAAPMPPLPPDMGQDRLEIVVPIAFFLR